MIALLLALCAHPMPAWRDELLCWPSGYCQPRVVNLGDWDPRPVEWDVNPFPGPQYPFESHLTDPPVAPGRGIE